MDRKARSHALKLLKNALNTLHMQIIEDSQDRMFSEMPMNELSGYHTYYAKGQELNFRSSSANKYYQPHSLYQYEEESEEEEDEQEEIIEFQYYFPQVDHRKYQSADFTPSNMRLKLIGEKEVLLERNHLTQAEQFSPGYSGDEDMEDSHQYKGSDNSSKSPLQNKITPQENIINNFKKLQKKQFIIKLITIELFILIKNIISYLILMIKIIITTC